MNFTCDKAIEANKAITNLQFYKLFQILGKFYWNSFQIFMRKLKKFSLEQNVEIISLTLTWSKNHFDHFSDLDGVKMDHIEEVRVDWVTGKIYWTTGRSGLIFATDYEAQHVIEVARGDFTYGLALHPCKGLMFWSDSGYKQGGGAYEPRIERATMAGSHRMRLIKDDISLATSLTIDYKEEFLFWADANKLRIERCDFEGKNRQTLLSGSRPKSIDVYGNWLYFVDPLASGIFRIEKHLGGDYSQVVTGLSNPLQVRIYSKDKQVEKCSSKDFNPCRENNGGCEQSCHVAPDPTLNHAIVECLCNSSYTLVNEGKQCVKKESACQGGGNFDCGGGQCIPFSLTCDGHPNCNSGADELPEFCAYRECPEGFYLCKNNKCLQDAAKIVCNGKDDCGDSSDEEGCGAVSGACHEGQFRCGNGHCINQTKVCDGHNDCHDAAVSDESNSTCPNFPVSCRGVRRRCRYTNICITPADLCDGKLSFISYISYISY